MKKEKEQTEKKENRSGTFTAKYKWGCEHDFKAQQIEVGILISVCRKCGMRVL